MKGIPTTVSIRFVLSLAVMLIAAVIRPPGRVAAQTADSTEKGTQLPLIVISATRTPKTLKEVPLITHVVGRREIETIYSSSLPDLLQNALPGLEFTYTMNQQVSLNMQGFGGNAVLFLVDGERMAGETLDNVDYARIDLDAIDHVEVVRGAGTALYGSNAIGGVVNLISRRICEPWYVRFNGREGSHREQYYGLTFGGDRTHLGSETRMQYSSCDSVALPADGDIGTLHAYHAYQLGERLTLRPFDALEITARAGYYFREREVESLRHDRYHDFSAGMTGKYRISQLADLSASYAFDQYDKSDLMTASGHDVRNYSNVQHHSQLRYDKRWGDRDQASVFSLGGDLLRDYLQSYQFSEQGNHVQYSTGLFVQWDWNPSKKTNIVSALRYDHYSSSGDGNLSPKISFMYRLSDVTLRASYASGFRTPTLKEMYMKFDMANLFMIYGNPDLKTERSHNINVAAEYGSQQHNITVAAFYHHVDDRIVTYWNSLLNGMRYDNIGTVAMMGMEAYWKARWSNGLGTQLSYTYTHEHFSDATPRLTATRPHNATLLIDYQHQWKLGTWMVAFVGRILSEVTGDEYLTPADPSLTARRTYPSYSLWRITLTQRFRKACSVNVAVDNIFDYTPGYYYCNSPATTGRTYTVGLTMELSPDTFSTEK